MRHARAADTDCVFVDVSPGFPALVPTAGLSPLLSSCTCQGPSAVLTLHCYTPPSSAPPAQL